MTALTWTAAIVAIIPLVTILAHLLVNGLGKLTPSFFTQLPSPPGVRGGGVANAIIGSGILVAIAERFKIPVHAIGVGEKIEDLQPFDAEGFARAIAGLEEA